MSEIDDTLAMLASDDLSTDELSTVERIILASTGTVQDLLSVIFGTPVRVEVISQLNYDTVLVRWSKLVVDNPDPMTIALAESVIPYDKNDPAFIGMMGDRDIGIGYAINNLGIRTERHILGIHVDAFDFARTYQIRGEMVDVLITESFSRETYASWQTP